MLTVHTAQYSTVDEQREHARLKHSGGRTGSPPCGRDTATSSTQQPSRQHGGTINRTRRRPSPRTRTAGWLGLAWIHAPEGHGVVRVS